LRLRLVQRRPVIAIVDTRDHAAGGDVLIVGNGHGGDVAGDLGGDGKLPRGDESIVGRFEMTGIVPIDIAGRYDRNGEKEHAGDEKRAPPRPLAGCIGRRAVVLRLGIVSFGRFGGTACLGRAVLRRLDANGFASSCFADHAH
jgi:hypothetical protein